MHRALSSLLAAACLTAPAVAQISTFVSPASSGTNGDVESLFDSSLTVGTSTTRHFTAQSLGTISPPAELHLVAGSQHVYIRCRDGADGALTGPYRDLEIWDIGSDRSIRTTNGDAGTAADMLEFEFSPPVGHFGAHGYDLDTSAAESAILRAYDAADALLYEGPIQYPLASNGDNTAHFIGIASRAADIAKVTFQVGSDGISAASALKMSVLDIRFGSARLLPGRMSTTFANNVSGLDGGAIYFDLECTAPGGATLDALDLNIRNTAGPASGTIDVYAREAGGDWAGPLATAGVTSLPGPGLPTHVDLSAPLEFGAGCSYELALVATGIRHAYSTTAVLPTTWSDEVFTISNGYASHVAFSEDVFSPRIPNVRLYYTPGGTCRTLATVADNGQGGVWSHSSAYELFAAGSFDMQNGALAFGLSPSDDSVVLQYVAGTALLPYPTPASTDLLLGDDAQVDVTTLGHTLPMVVGSNGWVAPSGGGGNSTSYENLVATMLGNPHRAFYSWKDLDPAATGGGHVYYDELVTPGLPLARAVVTYDGVHEWSTTAANTFQFICDYVVVAPGEYVPVQVMILWQQVQGSDDLLVGYSPDGASVDGGALDLSSTTTAVQTDAVDARLELVASLRPVMGPSGWSYDVTTQSVPPTASIYIGYLGLADPMLPLDALGMPGNELRATLDSMFATVQAPGTPWTWQPLIVPAAQPGLLGFPFYLQAGVLGTTVNSAFGTGALTSNGLRCVLGNR